MSCPETKKSLSGFLDGTLSPAESEKVAAHLADCPACRAELADLRRIDELMAGFADPPVDEDRLASLWSRVEDRIGAEPADEQAATAAFASGTPIVMTSTASKQPRWLVPTLAAAGVAIVAVFVITLMLVLSSERHQQQPGKTARASAAMAADAMGTDTMGTDAMGTHAMGTDTMGADAMNAMAADAMNAMGADAMGADAMSAMGTAMGSDAMSSSSRRRRRRRGSSSVSRGMSSSSRRAMHSGSSSHAMAPAMARAMSSGGSSLQDLLRRAGGSMGGSSGGMSAANLPKRLSMGQIRKGVYRIIGSARACFNRYRVKGKAYVRVTIRGRSGRVADVKIKGSFKGTPTGRCVARAFRRARFKRFSSGSQSFTFPLLFR